MFKLWRKFMIDGGTVKIEENMDLIEEKFQREVTELETFYAVFYNKHPVALFKSKNRLDIWIENVDAFWKKKGSLYKYSIKEIPYIPSFKALENRIAILTHQLNKDLIGENL